MKIDLEKIKKNGFLLSERPGHKIQNMAFFSLRNALQNYFSTYKSIGYYASVLDAKDSQDEKDLRYSVGYMENACSAITSFHHFAELILKDILRKYHVLLTIDASKRHDLLFDLLLGQPVEETQIQGAIHLPFSDISNRLLELLKSARIDGKLYGFIKDYAKGLNILNHLRNRITHGGTFVLRYDSLDQLFGHFALPFLQEILQLPEYKSMHIWKYRSLHCKIDPVEEIIAAFRTGGYPADKIALLKELGRAAYENPISMPPSFRHIGLDQEAMARSEYLAKHVLQSEFGQTIKDCPVCGICSLVEFPDSVDDHNEETGEMTFGYSFIYQVKCFCCGLQLDYGLPLEKTGLPIEDYWRITD